MEIATGSSHGAHWAALDSQDGHYTKYIHLQQPITKSLQLTQTELCSNLNLNSRMGRLCFLAHETAVSMHSQASFAKAL